MRVKLCRFSWIKWDLKHHSEVDLQPRSQAKTGGHKQGIKVKEQMEQGREFKCFLGLYFWVLLRLERTAWVLMGLSGSS